MCAPGDKEPSATIKIIIVGDCGVGKTCFLDRYLHNRYSGQSKLSFVDVVKKIIRVKDKYIELQIWDTNGMERFRAISPAYYRQADGVILMYSAVKPETFDNVTTWLSDVNAYAPPKCVKIVVGSKVDNDDVKITTSTVSDFAKRHGLLFCETSALVNLGVDSTFEMLVEKILEMKEAPKENAGIRIETCDPSITRNQESGGCCS